MNPLVDIYQTHSANCFMLQGLFCVFFFITVLVFVHQTHGIIFLKLDPLASPGPDLRPLHLHWVYLTLRILFLTLYRDIIANEGNLDDFQGLNKGLSEWMNDRITCWWAVSVKSMHYNP